MLGKSAEITRQHRAPDAVVTGAGVRLACYSDGDPSRPTLMFVHGYPDTAGVWDRLIAQLADRYHCVRYDVRGAGRSDRPGAVSAYELANLERDLAAVIDWASPATPVHLIGHDWGSIQGWEAATDPAVADRLASFTSISGPCLDHVGHDLRVQWRRDRSALLRQIRRSWYIGLFQWPLLASLAWRHLLAERWPATLARLEGEPLPVAPTWREDGRHGIKLYRANIGPRLVRPRQRPATVPVQVIVPRRDPFIGRGLVESMPAWVDDLMIDEIDAGHWAIATRAPQVARLIDAYIAPQARQAAATDIAS
ncbi:alpha/beta fold hydrolase [Salinisphaera sp. LB1]|uniref:alpha/beta fold hydrolase n=1 Tax=Salinisphaera sp. LB1 TaxID=2183911 RepID=UPI000D7D4AC4|nr:alpha/beta fold hydrolase [Salinisphaera sp. LB1]AWN14587.1 putative oxidoreductase [Salinisphaera sp. LB1]